MQNDESFLVLGTAGHIDHGKTALVRALTGTNTDRLPEEKNRGISIDLGFAEWRIGNVTLGIVDVPGHERFVRNMVAGASGVDFALLVVAADDGVMPQTREHLDILNFLGICAGVVVLTKTDLVDSDLIELVRLETTELCRGTFLENAPVHLCSTVTGEGLAELADSVSQLVNQRKRRIDGNLFRMPIDRAFSLSGQGCIVTGTTIRGRVCTGDHLELWPAGTEVRVRSIQSHGTDVARSGGGQRTALNLVGIKAEDVKRGDELATPGTLYPSQRLLVSVRYATRFADGIPPTETHRKPLLKKQLRLHIGTREVVARLVLRGESAADETFAELRLAEPVVAEHGQHFILRQMSPAITIAGGVILDPAVEPGRRIRNISAEGILWKSTDPLVRLSHWASLQNEVTNSAFAALRTGVPIQDQPEAFQRIAEQGKLIPLGNGRYIHFSRRKLLCEAAVRQIKSAIERQHPRRTVSPQSLREACHKLGSPQVLDVVFAELTRQNKLFKSGEKLGLAEMQVRLTRLQTTWQTQMLEEIRQAGLTPPFLPEFAKQFNTDVEFLRLLLQLKADEDALIQIDDTFFLAPPPLRRARLICRELFRNQPSATVAQLREAWRVSRRFAFPLCEYFDRQGWTKREGEAHFPGPKLNRDD